MITPHFTVRLFSVYVLKNTVGTRYNKNSKNKLVLKKYSRNVNSFWNNMSVSYAKWIIPYRDTNCYYSNDADELGQANYVQ